MTPFRLDGKSYTLPASWHQLTAEQAVATAPARLEPADNTVLRIRLLQQLAGIPRQLLRRMAADDVLLLLGLLDWIWETPLPAGVLPSFEHAGVTYLVPAADLSDLSLAEYALADHHLRQFVLGSQEQELLQLVATLCRPEKKGLDRENPEWDGDAREPYNTQLAQRRAAGFSELALGVRQLVLTHFLAGQQTVQSYYKKLFDQPEQGGGGAAAVEGSPIIDLAYALADKGVFGDFENTCKQKLYTILEYLDSKRRNAHE